MGASNDAGRRTRTSPPTRPARALCPPDGSGTAVRGIANNGIAGFFTSSKRFGVSGVVANNTKYGVYGGNDALTHGTGAAIRANGEHNHGLVATTADVDSYAIKATNTDPTPAAWPGFAIRAIAEAGPTTRSDALNVYPAAGQFCGESA